MKRAAIGIRMHSGWGMAVTIARDAKGVSVLDRRRIVIADPGKQGSVQPYHHAAPLSLSDAEKHIVDCAADSARLALAEFTNLVRELAEREYLIAGSAVLTASGRALPSLEIILGSHPLLHTAEGEFFRQAAKEVCEKLKIRVTTIKERDLENIAKEKLGDSGRRIRAQIASARKTLGAPWTADHKAAALAAAIVLAGR